MPLSTGTFVGSQDTVTVQWSDPTSTTAPVDPATGFTLVNPTLVTLVVRKPDGTTYSPAITITGTTYKAKIDYDQAGIWHWGWTASGNFKGYKPDREFVEAAPA